MQHVEQPDSGCALPTLGAEIARAERDALNWALQRGSRSGRVAWQFAKDWAAQHDKRRAGKRA